MTTPVATGSGTTTQQAWLTRLLLNPGHRQVQFDLANAAGLHRRLMKLVPDGLGESPRAQAGLLFRLDTQGAVTALLVQTRTPVDTSRLPTGYAQAQTRDMGPMLTSLRPGLPLRYRFLGNTIRRCGRNSTVGRWKQAVPLHGDDADQWWIERATGAGLVLNTLASEPAQALAASHPVSSESPGKSGPQTAGAGRGAKGSTVRIEHAATLFQGTATVQDPAALREALLKGIGRSKSYGCGLLSLAPAGRDG
ncbi:type I-E CRISPR-associated protein Cas6/Cse3/CasE [Streptomyces iconiensis]|uniref:Type I-E CRISPR-associated protein Cas6/Cse3/CasE n=1 Tax=Streptomyces iconiensis TaxID=1384038 RepID=A0ABT6ZNE6_9ACTN|nr:type I-E CRISPR-associated protein Cas6/Cse3/CasE [Streptomyces iconiensis]MDJ1130577.1 type I-E CRISPR-associated protein Cas6/Cse3/CasE [Streptomyces iconiensis]